MKIIHEDVPGVYQIDKSYHNVTFCLQTRHTVHAIIARLPLSIKH